MTVLLMAGCSSSSPEPPAPQGVLDGTYVASADDRTERFTFSTADHHYSVSVVGAATFTDEGSFTFDDSVLVLTSTTGARTKLDVRVLQTEALTGGSPQAAPSSVVPLGGGDLIDKPEQPPELYHPSSSVGIYMYVSCGPIDPKTGMQNMCPKLIITPSSGLVYTRSDSSGDATNHHAATATGP
jgi:hypothetical protein